MLEKRITCAENKIAKLHLLFGLFLFFFATVGFLRRLNLSLSIGLNSFALSFGCRLFGFSCWDFTFFGGHLFHVL